MAETTVQTSFDDAVRGMLKKAVDDVSQQIVDEEVEAATARIRMRLGEVLAACVPVLYRTHHDYGNEISIQVKLNEEALRGMVK